MKKQITAIILIAFFVGGIGGIVLGRFIIPYLGSFHSLSFLNKLVTTSPIIINRTQEVQLNEGVNVIDLIKQAGKTTVSIYDSKDNFLGNGMIVTSDGLIFTSANVVQKQTQFTVVTNDGLRLAGTLKDKDAKTNLAVLTTIASDLPVSQFSNAADLQTGQRVIYLGRGNVKFEHAALAGLITQSLANEIGPAQISSDVTLTPDYLGGPIINLSGHVVGMTLDASQSIISENLQTALTKYLTK